MLSAFSEADCSWYALQDLDASYQMCIRHLAPERGCQTSDLKENAQHNSINTALNAKLRASENI